LSAIIFDLFGTLIDESSDELAHKALSKYLADVHGGVFTAEEHLNLYHELIESRGLDSSEAVWEALLKLSKLKNFEVHVELKSIMELHVRFHAQYAVLYDDVAEAIEVARKFTDLLGVVSDADKDVALAILESAELLKYFSVVVTSGELGIRKPDPRLFLEACNRLGITPSECVVIGDSWRDVEGGKRAGMKVVLIARSPPSSWETSYEPDDRAGNLVEAVSKAIKLLTQQSS